MTRPLIGATTLGFGTAPIEHVFEGLVSVDAECCELNGRPGQHGGETLTAARVQPLVERTGVRVTSVGGYNDFAAPDLDAEVERLLDACRLAHELGVGIVRAMVADTAPGITLEGVRPRIVDAFGRAVERAGRLGVRLGIENHGRLANDGRWLLGVVEEVAAPNLGFTLDTGNFAWAGRPPATVADDIAAVLQRTVSVHVKDVAWSGDTFTGFVPAGEGGIDLDGLLAALAAQGYAGPIVSEFEGPGSHHDGTARSINHLKRLVQSRDWPASEETGEP
jgi:sugar phosphate isomerase/epimerase